MMSLYGPAWLRWGYWICISMAVYKIIVSYIGFYEDNLMLSVVGPGFIVVFSLGILWYPFNFLWMLFWDWQEKTSFASRIIIPLLVGAGVFFLGTFFEWQLWTFPAKDAQFLMFYWWDSVCVISLLYAVYAVYEFSIEGSSSGESATGAFMFTVVYLAGAAIAFLASSAAFILLTEDMFGDGLFLFAFFVAAILAYSALVLPFSLVRQSITQWTALRHKMPDEKRVNYVKKYFSGYVPIFTITISWFMGMWLFGAGLFGEAGTSSSSVIVLVNGVATGAMFGSGAPGMLVKLVLFLFAAMLFMSSSNAIAQWFLPLKKQEITSNQDDVGAMSDRIFLITRAAARGNSADRKLRFKIIASGAYVTLIVVSMSSMGINKLLATIVSQISGVFGG